MKILSQLNKFVRNNLPVQTLEEGREYTLSKYVIREGNALYNSLTNESILVEDFEKDKRQLILRWFMVPTDMDISTISHFIRQRNLTVNNGPGSFKKTSYVIFTTTGCNAACDYCFEKNYKVLTMSEETSEKVAEYIITTAASSTIRLKWFGGEPLLNKKAMNIISSRLKERGINFRAEISTNGDLFPECTDEEILLWNPDVIQFTVDDSGDNYDQIKHLPKGAYERLKETTLRLSKLMPKTKINLRVHFDPKKGAEPCYRVIDDFKPYPNVQIYSRAIYHEAGMDDYKELMKVEDYIIDSKKHSVFEFNFSYGSHCMSDSKKIACITPTGDLSPCEHFAYGEHVYGSIYSKDRNEDILKKWSVREKYVTPSCKDCPLYPSCRKLVMCPAEGKCSDGYQYYQIETIKRALRKKVEEINGDKGH